MPGFTHTPVKRGTRYEVRGARLKLYKILVKPLNIAVEWVTLMLHSRDNPASNLDPNTGKPDGKFSCFLSLPPGELRDFIKIRTRPLSFTYFRIYYSPIILHPTIYAKLGIPVTASVV
jgi:hypothetical protein